MKTVVTLQNGLTVMRPVVKFPTNLKDVWETMHLLNPKTAYTLVINWNVGHAVLCISGGRYTGICVYPNISYRHLVKKVYAEYAAIMSCIEKEKAYEGHIVVRINGEIKAIRYADTLDAAKRIKDTEVSALKSMGTSLTGEKMDEIRIQVFSKFIATGETAVAFETIFYRWLVRKAVNRHYANDKRWTVL